MKDHPPHIRLIEAKASKPGRLPHEGYSDHDFWGAFARIYWPDLTDARLAKFADTLAEKLPVSDQGAPLRVLVLGFGVGACELPILQQLRRREKRPLHAFCIDWAKEPLAMAAHVVSRQWPNLSRAPGSLADELVKSPGMQWTRLEDVAASASVPNGDMFTFVSDDLDYELDPAWTNGIRLHRPSQWDQRIRHVAGDQPDFDLVIASFCFFHLDWWRATLFRALALLKPGGVFIYSKADGDENLFEGRDGAAENRQHCELARKIFRNGKDGIFDDPRVREMLRTPRAASAAKPFDMEQLLERLEGFGLEADQQSEPDYDLQPQLDLDHYVAMLKSRGYSTFRMIEAHLGGKAEYDSLVERVTGPLRKLRVVDRLLIHLDWRIFKVTDRGELLSFPLASRFLGADAIPINRKQHNLADAYRREYETIGSLSLNTSAHRGRKLSSTLARQLTIQGLLHQSCIAGEFAFVDPVSNSVNWDYFANPLALDPAKQLSTLKQIHSYLGILAARSKRFQGFSNTKLLMQNVMPKIGRPCCFTYLWPNKDENTGVKVDCVEHRSFTEIRFHLPSLPIPDAIRAYWDMAWNACPPHADDQLPVNERFTLSRAVWAENSETLSNLHTSVDNLYPDSALETVRSQLCKSIMDHRSPAVDALHDAVTHSEEHSGSQDNFGFGMAQTILGLAHWADTGQMSLFPATYYLNHKPFADDLVFMIYDRTLPTLEMESEYHKINSVFERTLLLSTEMRTSADIQSAISHETQQVASSVRGWAFPIESFFEVKSAVDRGENDSFGIIEWNKTAPLPIEDCAFVPLRSLYNCATAYLSTWALTASPDGLPFYRVEDPEKSAQSMKDLVEKCWAAVRDIEQMQLIRTTDIASAEVLRGAYALRNELLRALPPPTVSDSSNLALTWSLGHATRDADSARKALGQTVWLSRLLLHLAREQLEHEPNACVVVEFARREGSSEVRMTWTSTPAAPATVVEAVSRLQEQIRMTKEQLRKLSKQNGGKGKDVRGYLISKISESAVVITDGKGSDAYAAPYVFCAFFHWE